MAARRPPATALSLPLPIPTLTPGGASDATSTSDDGGDYERLCDYRLWVFTQRVAGALGASVASRGGQGDYNYADDDALRDARPCAYSSSDFHGPSSEGGFAGPPLMFDLSVDGY